MATDTLVQAPPISSPRRQEEWPARGRWTYEDYRRLPDDGWRYEIIEGELFTSPAPSPDHQEWTLNLGAELRAHCKRHDAGRAYVSPIDVILSDLATPVQPDVIFIAKHRMDIIKKAGIEGAPDLVIEVLSPSNWLVDRREKLRIYAEGGVQEYWIVDPDARTIEQFGLKGSMYELVGKFGIEDTVHCRVLDGFSADVKEVCPAAD